ncbi:histidine kinase [Sedimentibacter sp. zth1]|uniref:histidine kinase n=1 Tax=Sedimentibacter sp. zth1 TaxID=2816908 RepID=UPI001A9304DF|nr:histidine kinase [Sedimentibacter sp. zth1]QSX05175.1 histidine kinase [Sedimentibacter sp. zth1]
MDTIKLEIPKKSEFISCVRLTTSSISNYYNFDIDKINDIKVIISEICTFFINSIKDNNEPFLIEYFLNDNEIEITVTDKNKEMLSKSAIEDSEMFVLIIDSLADYYNINYENNNITFKLKHSK